MTNYITEWKQKELIAKVSGQIVAGMDAACKFAVGQAKAKAPVRTGFTKRDISYKVFVDGNDVIGAVGVFKGSKAWYARFPEFGTSRMAARPFLRPAIWENKAKIMKLIAGGK